MTRAFFLADRSKSKDGVSGELGNGRSSTFAILKDLDAELGVPNVGSIQQGQPQPRNWHTTIGEPIDAGADVRDARVGIQLIADHENPLSGWRMSSRSSSSGSGLTGSRGTFSRGGGSSGSPVQVAPDVGGALADAANVNLDDWPAAQRSTRFIDYDDPLGRTALLCQAFKVLDTLDGQYGPAVPLGPLIGGAIVVRKPSSQTKPEGKKDEKPDPLQGRKKFVQFRVASNKAQKTLIQTFNSKGQVTDEIVLDGEWATDPRLKKKDPPKEGETGERKDSSASSLDQAAAGYWWDGLRGSLYSTVFRNPINPGDALGTGREGTPICIQDLRHDAHLEYGQSNHGCIYFDLTDVATYTVPDVGTYYKVTMAKDSSAANATSEQDHETLEWRPWFVIPNVRNCVLPLDGIQNCPSASNTSAAFVAGQGQIFQLALLDSPAETAALISGVMTRYGILGIRRDDATLRTLLLADKVGGTQQWRDVVSVRSTAAANDLPHATGATGFAWGSLSALLDALFSSTQGAVLYRDAAAWAALAPSTAGYLLKTQGAGANPAWTAPPSSGWGGWTVVAKAANFTCAVNQFAVCNPAGNINATLPAGAALGPTNNVVAVSNISAFNVTYVPAGSDAINGGGPNLVVGPGVTIKLISDGASPATWTKLGCC